MDKRVISLNLIFPASNKCLKMQRLCESNLPDFQAVSRAGVCQAVSRDMGGNLAGGLVSGSSGS